MPFDKQKADRAVGFIEKLKHCKGEWRGKPLKLQKWQKKHIGEFFGTVNDDGFRQYRICYIEVGRKNGKSTEGAGIGLYLFFADGEMGAEIYNAAGDRDQAGIVFEIAANMVRQESELDSRCTVRDSYKRIVRHEKGSFYRAISSEERTKFGFNPHAVIFDELHVQRNRKLFDALVTSFGARRQPVLVMITTAGIYDPKSIAWEQHNYADQILRGAFKDPTFLPIIYAADKDEDWKDPKIWKKANPNLGVTVTKEFLHAECRKAQKSPAYENTFRRLYLNQWVQQIERWISLDWWDKSAGKIDEEALRGMDCYGGLDLATTTDIAALSLVFPNGGEKYRVLPYFWIPEGALKDRNMEEVLRAWKKQGYIEVTEGNVIDYKMILQKIADLRKKYRIREMAFDRWGATKVIQDLQEMDMEVVQFGQGFKSMSPPAKELYNLVVDERLVHGGNPILRWMADNVVVSQDAAGNIKPNKAKSTEKIDGIVATIMALDRALKLKGRGAYEDHGIRRIGEDGDLEEYDEEAEDWRVVEDDQEEGVGEEEDAE